MSQELNLDALEREIEAEYVLGKPKALALIARIRELERAQAAGEAEPIAWGAFRVGGDRDGQLYAFCNSQHEVETYITQVHQASDNVTLRDAPLYAAPPAAANHAGIPDGWISVNERMPTQHFYGLVALTTGTVIPGCYGPLFGWQWDETETDEDADAAVTHWMPFAAAPHPTESHALGGDGEIGRNDE